MGQGFQHFYCFFFFGGGVKMSSPILGWPLETEVLVEAKPWYQGGCFNLG